MVVVFGGGYARFLSVKEVQFWRLQEQAAKPVFKGQSSLESALVYELGFNGS